MAIFLQLQRMVIMRLWAMHGPQTQIVLELLSKTVAHRYWCILRHTSSRGQLLERCHVFTAMCNSPAWNIFFFARNDSDWWRKVVSHGVVIAVFELGAELCHFQGVCKSCWLSFVSLMWLHWGAVQLWSPPLHLCWMRLAGFSLTGDLLL
jgi:hypothetical protein